MFRPALLASVAFLGVAACEVDGPVGTDQAGSTAGAQTWLCGREYANQAWGYQRRGVVLDISGKVWRYEIRSMPNAMVNPWQPKDVSAMSEEELKLRYDGATATGKQVPAEDIARNLGLIGEAAQAVPTEPKGVGADMGQTLTYCYTYDQSRRLYSQVMLDNKGDWVSTNPSPAARTLVNWLATTLGEVN